MTKTTAAITAVHGYVPDRVLSNQDLEKMVDTNDEWITTRTGIKERRIAEKGQALSDFGVEICKGILKKRGITPEDIDMVIVGSITGDYRFPSTANVITDKMGMTNAWGFDLSAACSGFLYALDIGKNYIENGTHKKIIVIGADVMSSIINYKDRATCIIFGDGGGGVLLEPSEDGLGIQDSIMRSDGAGREFLLQQIGGSLEPITKENAESDGQYVYQEGKTVFKHAVKNMAQVAVDIMDRNNLTADDIAWLAPHQANLRIIDATANRMGLDHSKIMINIEKFGNTTAGTIPLLLWEWEDKLKKGDNIILAAFGGGFTWGSVYLKWAY
ncbi:ketoacyl-ACP synthase III [Paracrocinitomix mangrovi]|uniref:beta-ketoacyl-ACP synthase III n=1 Tax=Paracrocinitomix mangrovi TaxID=2862509 RepID=UPI001C8E0C77|nr:beta-ketoacyl-ACP synthase III [Paracrocinitomix mangrovi]UKN00851.1 ketoacyl-ACP synthase III [Paracrocinitomix mangrovi]